MKYVVTDKEIIYKGFLSIEKAHITLTTDSDNVVEYTRERVKREDAVAVLLFNKETESFLLTRQFRFAVHGRVQDFILEIPAGKIDPGESPAATALRETLEECGVELQPGDLVHLSSHFASPGYTEEMYHLYFAAYEPAQRISKGGGLESENEFIQLEEIKKSDFFLRIEQNELVDGKTILAGLLALRKNLL